MADGIRAAHDDAAPEGGVVVGQLDRAVVDRHGLAVLADAVEGIGVGGERQVERRVAGLLGERDRLAGEPGILAQVAVAQAPDGPVAPEQERPRADVPRLRRRPLRLVEHCLRVILRHPESPAVGERGDPRLKAERRGLRRLRQRVGELAHPAPVVQRLGGVVVPRPGRRARVPARRLERLPGGLPVLGQERRALLQALGVLLDERARDRGVNRAAALAELRAVGHLLGQRVLEGIQRLGVELLLIDELARDEVSKRVFEVLRRQVEDPLQDRLGELLADHRSPLQHGLLACSEPVDPRGEDGLHAGRHRILLHRRREPVGAALALKAPALDERLHELLDEERVASGALADQLRQPVQGGIGAEQVRQQRLGRLGAQRGEGDLAVVGARHPRRAVLGPEVQDGEAARPLHRLHAIAEEGLARRVKPVQILDEHDDGLARALGVGQALHQPQQLALARLRVHPGRRAQGVGHGEELEQQGQVVLE